MQNMCETCKYNKDCEDCKEFQENKTIVTWCGDYGEIKNEIPIRT